MVQTKNAIHKNNPQQTWTPMELRSGTSNKADTIASAIEIVNPVYRY